MSEVANAIVGSFFGSGNLDISIPGESAFVTMSCSWGPGLGFYLFLSSFIILGIVLFLNIKPENFKIRRKL